MRRGKAIEAVLGIKLTILSFKASQLQAKMKAQEAHQDCIQMDAFLKIAEDYGLLIQIAEGMMDFVRKEGKLPKDIVIGGEVLEGK